MGQLLKILFLVGIIAFVVFKLKRLAEKPEAESNNRSNQDKLDKPMTACSYCGTYVPEAEALIQNDKAYCCPEHRDLESN